jgi:hypothetical protein
MEVIPRSRPEIALASPSATAAPQDFRVLVFATYLGCAALLLGQIALNFVDIDIWHQMNLIRASVAAGHLLTEDPFAYTPTVHPMIDHEWGAGVLAFFLGKWMGGAGLLLLKFTSAFGTLLLLMLLALRRGATAAVLTFLAPLAIALLYSGFVPAVRAHAYSILFTACLLWALETDRQGDHRWLWMSLALFPFWVNIHAGFVVGLGFVFLYGAEQAIRRKPWRTPALVLCGMSFEVLLNPYGTRYLQFLARALTMARPRVPEWNSIWSLGWPMTLIFAAAVAVFVYALATSRTGQIPGLLLLVASGIEAFLHRKQLPFFAITWLCYVPICFQKTAAGRWLQYFARRRSRFLLLAWIVTIALCLTAAIRWRFWKAQVPQVSGEASYPVGAVDYLAAQNFHGNIMVPFRSGAYVSWRLYPAAKVAVDSRYEVAYPNDWIERVFRFYEARNGWRETLNAYPTDVVLAPRSAPIVPLLRGAGWRLVYVDAQFELYAQPQLRLPAVDRTSDSFSGVFP